MGVEIHRRIANIVLRMSWRPPAIAISFPASLPKSTMAIPILNASRAFPCVVSTLAATCNTRKCLLEISSLRSSNRWLMPRSRSSTTLAIVSCNRVSISWLVLCWTSVIWRIAAAISSFILSRSSDIRRAASTKLVATLSFIFVACSPIFSFISSIRLFMSSRTCSRIRPRGWLLRRRSRTWQFLGDKGGSGTKQEHTDDNHHEPSCNKHCRERSTEPRNEPTFKLMFDAPEAITDVLAEERFHMRSN